jgi:hypothetical protein
MLKLSKVEDYIDKSKQFVPSVLQSKGLVGES